MWFVGLLLICAGVVIDNGQCFEVVNQWNFLDFDFPYDYGFREMFRPENNVPTGLEIASDRIFLSTPRLRSGVAATLASVPRDALNQGATITGLPLQAYPSWAWHGAARGDLNCSGLISVYRIRQDSCNRLWVLDSGVMTSLEDFRPICPPKIVVFDLHTDQPVRIVQFPRMVLRPNSLLTNLVIDEVTQPNTKCDNAFVYITDTASPGIMVYNAATDQSWRFIHPTMFPDPDFGDYVINNEQFSLMDGVVGLAMSTATRSLFYQPLATDRVFKVSVDFLQKGPLQENEEFPVTLVGRKSSQGLGLAVDPRTDDLVFSPMTETAVAVWHPHTNEQRILAYDQEALQFANEVRSAELDNHNIWVLTTKFQKFFKRTVSEHETNIRVIRIARDDLIGNTLAGPALLAQPSFANNVHAYGAGGARFF